MFTKIRSDCPQVVNKPRRKTSDREIAIINDIISNRLANIKKYPKKELVYLRDNRESPYDKTALMIACASAGVEMVQYCIDIGIGINEVDMARYGDKGRPNWDGATALFYAISGNPEKGSTQTNHKVNRQTIECLLENGANPNVVTGCGHTPLLLAAKKNDVWLVNMLFRYGADPKFLDPYGGGPISWALHSDNPKITTIQALIKHGCDVNKYDKGARSLDWMSAMYLKDDKILWLLVRSGANVLWSTKYDYPPLFVAVRMGHVRFAKYLLSLGVDPKYKNHEGMTALKIAKQEKNKAMIRLLLG